MCCVHSNLLFTKVLPDLPKVDQILKTFFVVDTICQNKRTYGDTIRKKHRVPGTEKRDNMLEMIYEKKATENIGRQLPNNRRQIGQPQQSQPEVFIEDYAFSFAKGLSERDYTGCVVGVLVGEYAEGGSGDKILVRGVLEARDVLRYDAVCFTEDNWTGIYRDIREYFPGQQIVGWFLGGPGFLLEDEVRQKKIQTDNFGGGDKVFLKMDSIEKEQKVLYYEGGEFRELPGYYIFYEKNAEMQNYMAGNGHTIPVEEKIKVPVRSRREQGEKNSEKTGLRENAEESGKAAEGEARPISLRHPDSFYRLFYATGGILTCVAILVIAGLAMQIQERNQLKNLLNEQEKLVSSLQQVYVVEKGETVESICMKFYGSTERGEAVRLLNGLEAEEEPIAGQKIFLP